MSVPYWKIKCWIGFSSRVQLTFQWSLVSSWASRQWGDSQSSSPLALPFPPAAHGTDPDCCIPTGSHFIRNTRTRKGVWILHHTRYGFFKLIYFSKTKNVCVINCFYMKWSLLTQMQRWCNVHDTAYKQTRHQEFKKSRLFLTRSISRKICDGDMWQWYRTALPHCSKKYINK